MRSARHGARTIPLWGSEFKCGPPTGRGFVAHVGPCVVVVAFLMFISAPVLDDWFAAEETHAPRRFGCWTEAVAAHANRSPARLQAGRFGCAGFGGALG